MVQNMIQKRKEEDAKEGDGERKEPNEDASVTIEGRNIYSLMFADDILGLLTGHCRVLQNRSHHFKNNPYPTHLKCVTLFFASINHHK